ncbi:hypothetical protein D3C86_1869750 [compost metagenome]
MQCGRVDVVQRDLLDIDGQPKRNLLGHGFLEQQGIGGNERTGHASGRKQEGGAAQQGDNHRLDWNLHAILLADSGKAWVSHQRQRRLKCTATGLE